MDDRYIVIQESGRLALQVKVNEAIEEGYLPVGGVAVICRDNGSIECYFQAMLK